MLRVFLTGSYKPPREFNWNVGVILLVLTLLLSFTGYLLPWDQLAMWAITVGSNMARATPLLGNEGPGARSSSCPETWRSSTPETTRGSPCSAGRFVGANALLRFYVLHCVGIPLAAAVLMAVHFWRVRKDGGISGPCRTDAGPRWEPSTRSIDAFRGFANFLTDPRIFFALSIVVLIAMFRFKGWVKPRPRG
jgi:quinol-cytochrome oxidoreductase complex cytochrome b subunit